MRRRRISSSARRWWYVWHRQKRIVRREAMKQAFDAMFFGSGYVRIGESVPDYIEHIPIGQVQTWKMTGR